MVRYIFFKCQSDNNMVREAELGLRGDLRHVSVISGQGLPHLEDNRGTYTWLKSVNCEHRSSGSSASQPALPEQPSHFGRVMLKNLFGFWV